MCALPRVCLTLISKTPRFKLLTVYEGHWNGEVHTKFRSENQCERDRLEELDTNGRIIIKMILKTWLLGCRVGLCGWGVRIPGALLWMWRWTFGFLNIWEFRTKDISFMIIVFFTNLMQKFFITFIILLYMFRAPLCSSSGGYIVSVQHLVPGIVTLFRWLFGAQVKRGLCTEQSPKKSDDTRYQMLRWYNMFSWGWA